MNPISSPASVSRHADSAETDSGFSQRPAGYRPAEHEDPPRPGHPRRPGGMNISALITESDGACPQCGKLNGYLDLGPNVLGVCDSCKTYWITDRDRVHNSQETTANVLAEYDYVDCEIAESGELHEEWNAEQLAAARKDLRTIGVYPTVHNGCMNLLFYGLSDAERRDAIEILEHQLALGIDIVGPPEWATRGNRGEA